MTPLSATYWFTRGLVRGLRICGHSPLRRFTVTLLVAAVLWGSAIALGWEFADRLAKLETGNTVGVIVLSKLQSWLRLYPHK